MLPRILLVDDDASIQFGFTRYLSKAGFNITTASNLGDAARVLNSYRFEALLLDVMLPDGKSIDSIPEIRKDHPDMAIIVITAFGDISVAVEAMRSGANHFFTKPVSMKDLEQFLRKQKPGGTIPPAVTEPAELHPETVYFGSSAAIQKAREMADLAAGSDITVLIMGETGVGKGVFARYIHDQSRVAANPFVSVNCSNLKGEILASELFGHTRGAFTSAISERQGLLGMADGGTLFLDEIGNMSLSVQAEFLKIIEEKQYRRLGEDRFRRSDFRLICSTNIDLQEAVRNGTFRKDLYYRISVFPIRILPLRERISDIPNLFLFMLRNLAPESPKPSREVMDLFTCYSWPGNIREMKSALERALLIAKGRALEPGHFEDIIDSPNMDYAENSINLKAMSRNYITQILERCEGDKAKACKVLGISRATFYRRLKQTSV